MATTPKTSSPPVDDPAVAAHTEGLRRNIQDITREKQAVEAQLAELAPKASVLERLGGLEGVAVLQKFAQQCENDADAKAFAKGEKEEYDERILRRPRAEMQGKIDQRERELAATQARLAEIEQRMAVARLDNEVDRQIADHPQLHRQAGGLIQEMVRKRFVTEPDYGDTPIARDAHGNLEIGPNGQPLTVADWMTTVLPVEAPFLFQETSSSGSGSGSSLSYPPRTYTWDEMKDPRMYRAAKEDAKQRGLPWPPRGGFAKE